MELTVAASHALADDTALVGRELCRAYSDLVDAWLAELFAQVVGDSGVDGVALVAVGGYGRAELSLQSDIDVLLLHGGRSDIGAVADGLWYPIWDEGLKLGHAVRTVREALALAADDLDTATSLLQVRHLAGDEDLTEELAGRALDQWRKRSKRWLAELSSRVAARHEAAGEVAFLLEPDLKEGRGGLRDVHALRWAEAARSLLWEGDDPALVDAYRTPAVAPGSSCTAAPGARATVCCSRSRTRWPPRCGYADADDLMRDVAAAARTIAWRSDDAWHRIDASLSGPLGFRSRRDKAVGPRPRAARRRGPPHGRRRRSGERPLAGAAGGRGGRRAATSASTAARSTAWPRGRAAARAVARAGARGARRPAPGRATGHPGDRGARPAGPLGAGVPGVGGRAAASRSATPTTASPSTGT